MSEAKEVTVKRQDKAKPKTAGAIIAEDLAGQLGSSPKYLGAQEIDERKLAVLNDYTQAALGYFQYRGAKGKVRFFNFLVDWELVSSQGINGLARSHILKAIAAGAGIAGTEVAHKPNLIARNVWNREWKEKSVREGKTIVE